MNSVSGEEELALLDVPPGHTYTLYMLAEDNVGHEQDVDTADIIQVYFPYRQGKI